MLNENYSLFYLDVVLNSVILDKSEKVGIVSSNNQEKS